MDDTAAETVQLLIQGELVGFGPLRRDLVPLYQRWINDLRVTRTLSVPCRPMTREAEEAWLDHAVVDRACDEDHEPSHAIALLEMRVTGRQIAPGIEDPDDRLARGQQRCRRKFRHCPRPQNHPHCRRNHQNH